MMGASGGASAFRRVAPVAGPVSGSGRVIAAGFGLHTLPRWKGCSTWNSDAASRRAGRPSFWRAGAVDPAGASAI